MELILASQSPRRRELLGLFKIPFTVRVADVDDLILNAAGAIVAVWVTKKLLKQKKLMYLLL